MAEQNLQDDAHALWVAARKQLSGEFQCSLRREQRFECRRCRALAVGEPLPANSRIASSSLRKAVSQNAISTESARARLLARAGTAWHNFLNSAVVLALELCPHPSFWSHYCHCVVLHWYIPQSTSCAHQSCIWICSRLCELFSVLEIAWHASTKVPPCIG